MLKNKSSLLFGFLQFLSDLLRLLIPRACFVTWRSVTSIFPRLCYRLMDHVLMIQVFCFVASKTNATYGKFI